MEQYLTGFVCCWLLLGTYALIAEDKGWDAGDLFWIILGGPVWAFIGIIALAHRVGEWLKNLKREA